LEVERHERESGAESLVGPNGRLDRAAAGGDPDTLALLKPERVDVLGREGERLGAAGRGPERGALDAGVVRGEPAPCREPDRELVGQDVDRWLLLDRHERGPQPGHWVLVQPRVQEQLARVLLVVARPLDAAELLEALVRHPAMDRRDGPELVP